MSRAQLIRRLKERGIGTQVHYLPVHLQPYYRNRYGELELPGVRSYSERCLSLPLFPAMNEDDVDFVVETLDANGNVVVPASAVLVRARIRDTYPLGDPDEMHIGHSFWGMTVRPENI